MTLLRRLSFHWRLFGSSARKLGIHRLSGPKFRRSHRSESGIGILECSKSVSRSGVQSTRWPVTGHPRFRCI